jgi:hypothetical protein
MVAITSITPYFLSSMVIQEGGKTNRDSVNERPIGTSHFNDTGIKSKQSVSSNRCRRYNRILHQSHLYTIKEESEEQINREGENSSCSFNMTMEVDVFQILSPKVTRSKRSLQSGLSSLVLPSEKMFDASSVSSVYYAEDASQSNEEAKEDTSFSCGLSIDEDE